MARAEFADRCVTTPPRGRNARIFLAHCFRRIANESGQTLDVPVSSNSRRNPTRLGLAKEAQIPLPHTAMRRPLGCRCANIQCSDGSRAMADVAHDTSGPVSPKPGDIAPQQASRPDSPDKGKLRVFISYSRDDLEFADQLDAALNAYGFDCLIDRHGISGGEDWKRRLGNLIREADTVVFVLTPTSARSEICAWEVKEAARLGKRIIPVVCRSLEGATPPPQLR